MISVIIPTLNAAETLSVTFSCLIGPTVAGLVTEVIVAEGGSEDETVNIAEAAGAHVVECPRGRGLQLAAGANAAKGRWLLFLHADTRLEAGWDDEVVKFIEKSEGLGRDRAAAFRFQLDDFSAKARVLEKLVAFRCAILKAPYGDQGLLVSKAFYDRLGGHSELDLMEDVDLVRRIGSKRLVLLRSAAVTSAARYQASGYFLRILRNSLIMSLYACRVPPRLLARLYG
jgi:rSAM/selenodomain-associated transferase 2